MDVVQARETVPQNTNTPRVHPQSGSTVLPKRNQGVDTAKSNDKPITDVVQARETVPQETNTPPVNPQSGATGLPERNQAVDIAKSNDKPITDVVQARETVPQKTNTPPVDPQSGATVLPERNQGVVTAESKDKPITDVVQAHETVPQKTNTPPVDPPIGSTGLPDQDQKFLKPRHLDQNASIRPGDFDDVEGAVAELVSACGQQTSTSEYASDQLPDPTIMLNESMTTDAVPQRVDDAIDWESPMLRKIEPASVHILITNIRIFLLHYSLNFLRGHWCV